MRLDPNSSVLFVRERNMANSVESGVVSFDSALDESLKFLFELGMSRELRTGQKDAISTMVSGKDLLAVLPTGFGKSFIFQMLVLIKQIMTGKPSSAVVVCMLQSTFTISWLKFRQWD